MNSEDSAVISDLREQIKRLEARVDGFGSHGKTNYSINEIPGFNELEDATASSEAHGADIDHPTNLNFVPKVQKCNFMEFKNRFNEDDTRYAVDVLESGALFEQEYLEEQGLRDRLFEHGKPTSRAAKRKTEALVKETINLIVRGFGGFGFRPLLFSRYLPRSKERLGQPGRELMIVRFALFCTSILR
jgi:hypothetical protein